MNYIQMDLTGGEGSSQNAGERLGRERFRGTLDAGEFNGRLSEALLELSLAQLREVEWILLHSPTTERNGQRGTALQDLKPGSRVH